MDVELLIKPVSSRCDLDCDYCFYRDEASRRAVPCPSLMDEGTVRSVLEKFGRRGTLHVCFQGGEPLLAGLPWFERFVALAGELGCKIRYSVQTNGVLLDQSWCDFFLKHRFLVGISFDGMPAIHRIHRGRTSHKVMEAVSLLQKNDIYFSVLAVVTREMADNAPQVWDYLMANGLTTLEFIPCLDPIGGPKDRWLDAESYGNFLCYIADRWADEWLDTDDEFPRVMVRLFDSFTAILGGGAPLECGGLGICGKSYVIESDGSVYPCDFYCLDSHLLGNIRTDTVQMLDRRRSEMAFVKSSITTDPECRTCPARQLCMGGCRRQRDADGKFRFCESYKVLIRSRGGLFAEAARRFSL